MTGQFSKEMHKGPKATIVKGGPYYFCTKILIQIMFTFENSPCESIYFYISCTYVLFNAVTTMLGLHDIWLNYIVYTV